jgi:AcrR family transcriptional regulator
MVAPVKSQRRPHKRARGEKAAPDRALEERLFRAGLHAFAARGYAEVSADAIAREAGATKPMLYYYYGSKAGLYRAVAERAFAAITPESSLAADEHAPPEERLRAYVRDEFARMRDNPDIARFIYRTAYAASSKAPHIDHWKLFLPSFELVVRVVEAAQRKKLIAPGPAPELALPLFGLIGIFAQVHLAGPLGEMLSDARADRLVELYLHGVSRRV